jgi:hypothetical protein
MLYKTCKKLLSKGSQHVWDQFIGLLKGDLTEEESRLALELTFEKAFKVKTEDANTKSDLRAGKCTISDETNKKWRWRLVRRLKRKQFSTMFTDDNRRKETFKKIQTTLKHRMAKNKEARSELSARQEADVHMDDEKRKRENSQLSEALKDRMGKSVLGCIAEIDDEDSDDDLDVLMRDSEDMTMCGT